MDHTSKFEEEGVLRPLTEREEMELLTDDHPQRAVSDGAVSNRGRFDRALGDRAAIEERIRANVSAGHGVTWVRLSDLISSGTGRIAGRGIDFEAELARRLRHPAEAARRAIRNRSSSLPPLDAFGRSRSRVARDPLGRS